MSNSQQSLSDVLYWFSLEEEKPTAALIDEYRERFPEYAEAITEFALDLTLDSLQPDVPDIDCETVKGPPSDVVMQSISAFQNARYHATKERTLNDMQTFSKTDISAITNPFSSLDSNQFRQLTRNIGVTSLFVAKLRDRQILPGTIPIGLTHYVAKELGVSDDLMIAHFSAQPVHEQSRVYYKALDKPTPQAQETFEEAVRTSGLSPEQQARLLKL